MASISFDPRWDAFLKSLTGAPVQTQEQKDQQNAFQTKYGGSYIAVGPVGPGEISEDQFRTMFPGINQWGQEQQDWQNEAEKLFEQKYGTKGIDIQGPRMSPIAQPSSTTSTPFPITPPIAATTTPTVKQSGVESDVFPNPTQSPSVSNLMSFSQMATPRMNASPMRGYSPVSSAPMSTNWAGINSLNWWQQ